MVRGFLVAGAMCAVAACPASELPVIEIVGQRATGASDAASAGTVGAAQIAARPMLRTGELLEFVPGLAVTQHSGDGKANQYFLRGFNLDHGTDFATFVDGMPVNMRSHAHGQGYTDLNFVIPELARRIDYRKGPYAAADGDFASAGSARIALADAVPDMARITAGGHGYQRVLVAGTAGPGGGERLLYGVDVQRNDGPWTVPEAVRRWSAVLRWSGGDGDDGWSVTAMAYRNRWRATDQVPSRAVERIGRFGSLDPDDGGHAARASLSVARHGPWNGGRVALDAWVVRSSLDLYSDFTYALDRPGEGDQFGQNERRTMLGADGSYAWRGTLAGIDLDHRAGVQVRSDRLAPVGLYTTVARRTTSVVRENRVRETSAGVFADTSAQWTPWLRTVAGLRGDAYRFDVDGRRTSAGIVTPKLSVIAGPWRGAELFFNAGHGFHSNDARGVADGVTPLVRTRGSEAGLRSEVLAGLETSLVAWRLSSASELVYVGDAGTTEPSRASRRHGVEWNTRYARGPLRVDLDLAVTRARYAQPAGGGGQHGDQAGNQSGDRVPGALERMASLEVGYAPAGRWSGTFNVRHLGPRALTEDDSVRSRASTLASARIAYRFSRHAQLTLDLFNLFDRAASDIEYYYASRLPGEAMARDDVHFHPVEPRAARLTLHYTF